MKCPIPKVDESKPLILSNGLLFILAHYVNKHSELILLNTNKENVNEIKLYKGYGISIYTDSKIFNFFNDGANAVTNYNHIVDKILKVFGELMSNSCICCKFVDEIDGEKLKKFVELKNYIATK